MRSVAMARPHYSLQKGDYPQISGYRPGMSSRRTTLRARITAVTLGAAVTASVAVAPTPAAADPTYVAWSDLLPAWTTGYDPTSADECVAGKLSCVDKVIRRMERQFDQLASSCDHNAVFALSYLRTTEEYRRAATEPGFFADTPFVNHEDAVFASYYFDAFDAWERGDRAQTPEAWRIALDAAADRRVTGSGNLMLGINAHVNRDLPFVLAAIGLVKPDGSSRKPDHDKVNVFLNRVTEPLLAEEAARFDPGMDDAQTPYGLSYTALMQLLVIWRETAWRHAELLAEAPDRAARDRVAAEIEAYAADTARTVRAQYAYPPVGGGADIRDAYCVAQQAGG